MYIQAAAFSLVYRWFKVLTGLNLPGLGHVLDGVKTPCTITVKGNTFYFEPCLARNYGIMFAGYHSEPETHLFFHAARQKLGTIPLVIDVGANIGEMAVAWAAHAHRVIAFEPHVACARVIEKSARLSGVRIDIRVRALLDRSGVGRLDGRSENASTISLGNGYTPISTLDNENIYVDAPVFLLIDTEGAELAIIRGGQSFISEHRPLIVFEYNHVSRDCFTLDDIQDALGPSYRLFRLRQDGLLDDRCNQITWNAVAAPAEGPWANVADNLTFPQRAEM